jgi:hypothetical protein
MDPTPISAGKRIRERGEFENCYYNFVEALQILVQDAPTQCKMMGNHNVAWELKDDLLRGAQAVNYPSSSRLTAEQKQGILDLASSLEGVPSTDLPAGPDPKDNLAAMNHPSWTPLRHRAAQLLLLLAPATEECKRYLSKR